MEKTDRIKLALALAASVVLLVLMMPRKSSFSYDYRKGREWKNETLYAEFDFPIVKSEAQMREEKASAQHSVVPYYRYSSEVVSKNLRAAESLPLGSLKSAVISSMRSIYAKGILTDDGVKKSGLNNSDVLYVHKDKRAVKSPVSEVYRLSDARAKLLDDVSRSAPGVNVDSVLREASVYDLIAPNLNFDQQTTQLVSSSNESAISPTQGYVSAGQLIVSNGEMVTAEIAQMLDSYKKEYEANVGYAGPRFFLWLGNIIVAMAIVSLLFLIIYFIDNRILFDNRFLYMLVVFLLFSTLALVSIRTNEKALLMVPFTLAALYLQAFFRTKVILPVYIVTLFPLLIFAPNGAVLFVMFVVAGLVATYFFQYMGKGWHQFIVALITFAVLTISYLGFYFLGLINAGPVFKVLMKLFGGSMLAVAGYPLIYLFEKFFNLLSSSRLRDLCDTSLPLLRTLEQKAPGTFQHSLQVMNLCDAAARSIGANTLLVRAGALYHDLGKMNNPQCFIENESLLNKPEDQKYHSKLTPVHSAQDIIRHVSDGVDIARRNRLPERIVEFILTHHGTTRTGYFWGKHLSEGGNPADEPAFLYSGEKPRTKEQIILMLCDSIEAASRTLQDYSPEATSAFVDKIIEGKRSEGQFDDADISIKDLRTISSTIKSFLAQVHHERISYPDKNNKNI
ncbi:MAG: HDIG domain-containing protein [Bacteroidales bacterium]|nr:HDIG domain-containing protein [Candidatus Cryptobacteroides choladohippi]